jgi:hypothetical protein
MTLNIIEQCARAIQDYKDGVNTGMEVTWSNQAHLEVGKEFPGVVLLSVYDKQLLSGLECEVVRAFSQEDSISAEEDLDDGSIHITFELDGYA